MLCFSLSEVPRLRFYVCGFDVCSQLTYHSGVFSQSRSTPTLIKSEITESPNEFPDELFSTEDSKGHLQPTYLESNPLKIIMTLIWADLLAGKDNIENPPPTNFTTDADYVVSTTRLAAGYCARLATVKDAHVLATHMKAATPGYGVDKECRFLAALHTYLHPLHLHTPRQPGWVRLI